VHKTWNVLSKQIPLTPGFFWSSHGVSCHFLDHWRAWLNMASDFDFLMRSGVLLLFLPGERGVITLAIKKDAPFLW
jgi:hypothetical protein